MQIKLTQLLKNDGEQVDICYGLDLSEVELWGERPLKTPVKVEGNIKNRADMVSLTLSITAQVETQCARCLKSVSQTVQTDVSYDIVTELQNEDDEHLLLIEGDELDVDETVRTALLLDMPMRFLCSEDCKGLCSKCGADLNEGDCGCDKQEVDPRLAILKTLL